MVDIIYAKTSLIGSFYDALKEVASERVYLEMIEPPPLEDVFNFQAGLISKSGPVYYAVTKDRVVGWCDIFPMNNPRQSHRGGLGMGIISSHRSQGIGGQLLEKTLSHAKVFGLEKVELQVYTTNNNAIKLYKKFGFIQEGLTKNYRKLDGVYFDSIAMAKFL